MDAKPHTATTTRKILQMNQKFFISLVKTRRMRKMREHLDRQSESRTRISFPYAAWMYQIVISTSTHFDFTKKS